MCSSVGKAVKLMWIKLKVQNLACQYIFSKSRVGRIGVFAGRFWAPDLKFATLAVEQCTCGISILTLTLACTAGSDSLLMENFEAKKKKKRSARGGVSSVRYWIQLEVSSPLRPSILRAAGRRRCSLQSLRSASSSRLQSPHTAPPCAPLAGGKDTHRNTRGRDHVSITSSIF